MNASQSHLPQNRLRLFHGVRNFREGRFRDPIPDDRHRGFQQDSGGIALIVTLDLSVLRMGCLVGDVRQFQRERVCR